MEVLGEGAIVHALPDIVRERIDLKHSEVIDEIAPCALVFISYLHSVLLWYTAVSTVPAA